jgi:hypothetical protein
MVSYRQLNKEKISQQTKVYIKTRSKHDIGYRLALNLRKRLNTAVRRNIKNGSAVSDLGCTLEQFRLYLESKFTIGMSWDNYGLRGWHIDHIKPLASFDLTIRDQVKTACHYTNMQPLWAKDNLKKGKW